MSNETLGVLGMLAGGLAGRAIDYGMGLETEKWSIDQQRKFAKEMQEEQIRGNSQLAKYSQGLQLDTWNKTSAPAQVKKLREAGLNVGLMYPGGGGGGTTGSANAGTAGTPTPSMGAGINAGMGLQLKELANQTALVQSQVELNKAQAAKISGVDTQKTTQEIANIAQNTANAGVQNEILRYDKELKSLEYGAKELTFETTVKTIEENYNKLKGEAEKAINEGKLSTEGYNEMIKQIQQATIEQAARIMAIREGVQFNYGDSAEAARWVKMATDALGSILSPVKIPTGGNTAK